MLRPGQKGSCEDQLDNVRRTCECLVPLIEKGYDIVIGHGNGPQVGNIMLQQEAGDKEYGIPSMPMDVCGAQTQGSIAYMIETAMEEVLRRHGISRGVVSLITRVEVSPDDPMFLAPTKPVGPYYSMEKAKALAEATGAVFREDPKGNGWRKVVPSPVPVGISNLEVVRSLARQGNIVVTVGGGGIPVVDTPAGHKGVEAVIDKDLASSLLARSLGADEFYILTDVPKVYLDFRSPDERPIDSMSVAQAREYLSRGQFTEGSMAPKVRAGIMFVEGAPGKECIITEAGRLGDPACGTRITG